MNYLHPNQRKRNNQINSYKLDTPLLLRMCISQWCETKIVKKKKVTEFHWIGFTKVSDNVFDKEAMSLVVNVFQ